MYNTIFIVLIAVLVFGYLLERILDTLNLKHTLPELPDELSGIFDPDEYKRSQLYKRDNTRFSFLTSSVSLVVMLLVFFFGGFGWLDDWISTLTTNYIVHVLLFFGMLALVSDILTTPFALYDTFVIEERYGFNRTSIKTFVLDKIKGWFLGAHRIMVLVNRPWSSDPCFCFYEHVLF